ncbi:molybdopterin-dependent oxidoreductase [Salipiger aestuarii]|uniref:molybdopterin-dependent oxidoreductase n=1 Tax=Salipiger aestuarii TaxID=568098 RepID=UPI0016816DC8|nr:molybdopterin-dependent oxidoreductase [Salipiger aestuarii]
MVDRDRRNLRPKSGGCSGVRSCGARIHEALRLRDDDTLESGEQTFTGVPLYDLLAAVGASGRHARAMAFSDYIVDIPLTGGTDAGPITAYRHNGSLMAVRDGGPLWIVCPYDSRAAYQTEQISSRRIWQLGRIVVVE